MVLGDEPAEKGGPASAFDGQGRLIFCNKKKGNRNEENT
jgi:hypothetical protein